MADVVPLVPIRPDDMERARAAALEAGRRVGELGCRVFLTRRPSAGRRSIAAEAPRRCRGGSTRGEPQPDFGPRTLDSAAGGVIVGARRPLVAFNVNLAGLGRGRPPDRGAGAGAGGGGFPGVRALGLDLPRAGVVQVSMNVEDWEAAALHQILARVAEEAEARGAEVVGSEYTN